MICSSSGRNGSGSDTDTSSEQMGFLGQTYRALLQGAETDVMVKIEIIMKMRRRRIHDDDDKNDNRNNNNDNVMII